MEALKYFTKLKKQTKSIVKKIIQLIKTLQI